MSYLKYKFNINKIHIAAILMLIKQTCDAQTQFRTYMEPLNINDIIQNIQEYSKIPRNDFLPIKKGNVRIVIDSLHQDKRIFGYTEINEETGDVVDIHGDSFIKNGIRRIFYTKVIKKGDHPIVIKISYDQQGKVTAIGKIYSEKHLLKNHRLIEYPIEKTYFYANNGDISKIVDYDSLYKYSLQDIFNFLKKHYAIMESIDINAGNYPEGLFWEIHYNSTKYGKCEAMIDAKNGKVVKDDSRLKKIYIE